jgi:hypothetical protein
MPKNILDTLIAVELQEQYNFLAALPGFLKPFRHQLALYVSHVVTQEPTMLLMVEFSLLRTILMH